MTNHDILFKLAEQIILPDGRNRSIMCSQCLLFGCCDDMHKNMCTETFTNFIHEKLVEIVGGEITIKKRGNRGWNMQ